MNDPENDDLLPEHTDIDAFLAASHQNLAERLAEVLDLDTGLTAILTSGKSADQEEPASAADPGQAASSPAGTPSPGGQAADVLAARCRVLALARVLARARARARDLAYELTLVRPGGLQLDQALVHARYLARDLAYTHTHKTDRNLARNLALARHLARNLDLDLAYELDLDLDPALARGLARELQNALSQADILVCRPDAAEVDASGADLSTLDLREMSVLEGVVWTDETTWPLGVREQVRPRSREIRPGVYQIHGGSERDPSALITT